MKQKLLIIISIIFMMSFVSYSMDKDIPAKENIETKNLFPTYCIADTYCDSCFDMVCSGHYCGYFMKCSCGYISDCSHDAEHHIEHSKCKGIMRAVYL